MHVADGQVQRNLSPMFERIGAPFDELVVERPLQTVLLRAHTEARRLGRHVGLMKDRREIEPLGFPVIDRRPEVQPIHAPDHLVYCSKPELGHVLPDFLRDEPEEVHDELGLPGEVLAQLRVLGGDAHRAGVQMADTHHHAARDDERRCREAEFPGAHQGRDDDVAPGLQLAVNLHHDAIAEPVQHEHLLRLGEPELPGNAPVLDRGER